MQQVKPPLRFLARGSASVTDFAAQKAGVRKFVGRAFDASLGPVVDLIGEDDKLPGTFKVVGKGNAGGFVPLLGQVHEYPFEGEFRNDYLRALRDGDLWPADEATAREAGVPFDPDFGNEHDDAAKAVLEKHVLARRKLAMPVVDKPDPNAERAAKLAAAASTPATPAKPAVKGA